ncbi:hypothetical protein BC830DRAFT_1085398 [Chytriomyces sp. MP71]|nr:hypothetical protein BC830DRAFT_1085398 [Chytriomyces sp. MP71]
MAAVETIDTLNDSMGLVSFATVVIMLHSNRFQVGWRPASWVFNMAYLDAFAFLFFYLAGVVEDAASCQYTATLLLMADVVWSVKDFFKFGFIVYRALAIVNARRQWPIYFVSYVSLGLYWWFLLESYPVVVSHSECAPSNIPTDGQLALYLFWSVVEIGVSAAVVFKMSRVSRIVQKANIGVEVYTHFKQAEEVRLLIATLGMGAVTILAVDGLVRRRDDVAISRIVFVYGQLVLVLGAAQGSVGQREEGEPGDDFSDI